MPNCSEKRAALTFAITARKGVELAEIGGAIVISAGLMAADGGAQPFDEALTGQLEGECGRLLGADRASDVLTDRLETICRSGLLFPLPTTELTSATSAGSALTGSASGQQQRLLRDVGEPEPLVASTSNDGGGSADTSIDRLGIRLFGSVGLESLDRDSTPYEGGYDSQIKEVSAGAGYLVAQGWEVGGGIEYFRQDGDLDAGGNLDNRAFGIFGFVSGEPFAGLGTTLVVEYFRNKFDRKQTVMMEGNDFTVRGPISSDYDADAFRAVGLVSYRAVRGRFFVEPFAAVDWSTVEHESYSQKGNTGIELRFDSDRSTSLVSSLGASIGAWLRYGLVAFSPALTAAWKHEFEADQRSVKVSFVNDTRGKRFSFETQPPDRNFGVVNASLAAALPNGLQPYLVLQTLVGHSYFDNNAAFLGVSFTF